MSAQDNNLSSHENNPNPKQDWYAASCYTAGGRAKVVIYFWAESPGQVVHWLNFVPAVKKGKIKLSKYTIDKLTDEEFRQKLRRGKIERMVVKIRDAKIGAYYEIV